MEYEYLKLQDNEIQSQIQNWYTQWILVERLYADFAQHYGITSNAMSVLRILLETPDNCTQRVICDSLTLPKQTVSSLLESLERNDYITKKNYTQDKRNKLIILTEKGKEFTIKVLNNLSKAENEAFLTLSEQDRKDFTRINESLTQALKNKMQAD